MQKSCFLTSRLILALPLEILFKRANNKGADQTGYVRAGCTHTW